jgi:hypothetical protein
MASPPEKVQGSKFKVGAECALCTRDGGRDARPTIFFMIEK